MYLYVSMEGRTKWLSDKKGKYTIKRKRAAPPISPLLILYSTHFTFPLLLLFPISFFKFLCVDGLSSKKTRLEILMIYLHAFHYTHLKLIFYYILLLFKTSLFSTLHPAFPFCYYNLSSKVESFTIFCIIPVLLTPLGYDPAWDQRDIFKYYFLLSTWLIWQIGDGNSIRFI